MVYVFIALGAIILLGLVIGLARRPKAQAAQQAHVDAVRSTAVGFGWQIDQVALGDLYRRLPQLGSVLGNDESGVRVTAQLSGQWRGVPICAAQISYATEGMATRTWHTATLLLVKRPFAGPEIMVGPQQRWSWIDTKIGYPPFDERFHVYAPNEQAAREVLTPALAGHLVADARMADRVLFFGGAEVATLFPGPLTQQQVLTALGDLLVEVVQRMGVR
ncbi:hypothetical protein [Amycolatopsis anabasis]|uniref:hypothetical protein n=1 Tax=Amycolatopsis anabasis TaxID=1840409 RepID=UPI00131E7DAD|nr:hypothetical protein [Amycolatopsis anabasis]